MSRDDLNFDQMMQQMGVRPLHKRADIKPLEFSADGDADAAADAEFEAAMAEMEAPSNKDAVTRKRSSEVGVREVRYSAKAKLHIQASLDLHGKHQEEALFLLERFIRQCREDGMREVAVISGKGTHSVDRVPVLKPLVLSWVLSDGRTYISSIGEAPRTYGGAGVWVVTLRPMLKR
jgi:DNA-nicking Smr family endonuclease